MKYTIDSIFPTIATMRKNSGLLEVKKYDYKNKSDIYFYDFSLLGDKVPKDIMERITEQATKHSSIIFPEATVKAISGDFQYYIDLDFQPYNVYSDSRNKVIYRIMECVGVRITTYAINCYGYVNGNEMPTNSVTYGKMRKSILSNLLTIEVA